MFGTVIIPHMLWKGLLVLLSIGCLILRIDINSLVPLFTRSQLPKRIEDNCRDEKHSHRWSYCRVVFVQILSSSLHSEEQVIITWILLLRQSSHHAVHRIKHVIVHCDHAMKTDYMPLLHPEGPISNRPQYFHDVLPNGQFILSCEKWLVISVFWILEPLACEFS